MDRMTKRWTYGTRAMLLSLAVTAAATAQTTVPAPTTAPAAKSALERMGAHVPVFGLAQQQPSDVAARLVEEPTRRVVKLANGLTILLETNTTAPVVACRLYIRAGSLTEAEFMGTGISHVLEHLVAGASSAKVKEAQSKQILQSLGNDTNAQTTYDSTCYFITTSKDKWPQAMDLLANWVTGAAFTQEQFEREYQVVQRELEMREAQAAGTFGQLIQETRYLVSPAKHPIIGYKPAFQKLTREDCQTYYNRMYVPDNMVVSIAGDIDLDQAEGVVRKAFATVQRAKVPLITLPEEPEVTAPRTTIAHADVRVARVCWAFPSVDANSPDMYPLDALANVLGQGNSSVLVKLLRDDKQLVLDIGAGDDTPSYVKGSLAFYAELQPEKINETRDALLAELENVKAHGIDPTLLEKIKEQMAASLIMGNQTADQKATRNGLDYLHNGSIDDSTIYVDRIKQVTAAQVQDAARRYIDAGKLLTTIVLPLRTPDSVVTGTGAAVASGAEKSPVERFKLPNGLTVLIERNTSSPLVAFRYDAIGGLLNETPDNNGIGNAMAQLLQRGTEAMPYEQVADYLDRTSTSLSASVSSNAYDVAAEALKPNASDAFHLFRDTVLHPALKQDELDKIRPRLVAGIDQLSEDWFSEAYRFFRQSYFPNGSPYHNLIPGERSVVEHLSADDIRKHYEQYLKDPAHAVLTIYGDVDVDRAKAWAQDFAAMPATDVKFAADVKRAAPGTVTQDVNKATTAVLVGYGPGLTVDSPDRFAVEILRTMLSGYNGPLGSWLFESLRGQGLVYTVQAINVQGKVPGVFLVAALGEADKSARIVAGIQEQIDRAKAGKFTEDDLARAKEQIKTGEKLKNQTIAEAAADAAMSELFGLGYDAHAHFSDEIDKVTRDDLIRVANTYLKDPLVAISKAAH
jgi:zinc protease